ncbi:hypothetical protein M3Y97_00550100 [Aphelenchoides bicaudatus]|nr:hypothetical protein M3Y97_00550100 [Aphelenchoides bicaudatus]
MTVKYAELATKVIKHFGSQKNWNKLTGQCRLLEAQKDRVKVEFDVDDQMTNLTNNLHGGCTASLVDMITTVAILTHDSNKHAGVSVNLNVTYTRAAKLGETVVVDAFVEKRGKSLAFTRANLYRKSDNKSIAFAEHVKAFSPHAPPTIE